MLDSQAKLTQTILSIVAILATEILGIGDSHAQEPMNGDLVLKMIQLNQERLVIRLMGALLILLLATHCSLAGPEPPSTATPLFSRDAITMALVVFVIGGLVQWAVITADSRRISHRRMLGSIVLAGVGGAAAAIVAMDQVRSPMIAALIGIGAAYAGGEAVLRRLGETGQTMTANTKTAAPDNTTKKHDGNENQETVANLGGEKI